MWPWEYDLAQLSKNSDENKSLGSIKEIKRSMKDSIILWKWNLEAVSQRTVVMLTCSWSQLSQQPNCTFQSSFMGQIS